MDGERLSAKAKCVSHHSPDCGRTEKMKDATIRLDAARQSRVTPIRA